MLGLIGMVLSELPGKKSWLVPSQGKLSSFCIHSGRAAQGTHLALSEMLE